jgi:cell filamentation protein, protein adenylyltransferase
VERQRDRYDVRGLAEAQFEPGSRRRVLKNLLGIKRKHEMDRVEGREQIRALEELTATYDKDHRFTAADVCRIHRTWLGSVYSWAGQYRQVDLSRDEFRFANAAWIPKLMAEFERGPLRQFTPCRPASLEKLSIALATVHVELILIHPFREGNGRAARLLAVLMGLQAELPPLFFDRLSGRKRQQYFSAVRKGQAHNYAPMAEMFSAVIRRTLQLHGQR